MGQARIPVVSAPVIADSHARVVINAVHARSGGGVTYLRNIVPYLAGDGRLDLHLFLLEDQLDILHPIDQRVRVHVFRPIQSPFALMAWEQTTVPFLARVMGADVIFSPANFGCLLSNRNVILLRNALSVARIEPRLRRWPYWGVLGVATFLSILRARKVLAVSHYAARALMFGFARWLTRRTAVIYHGVSRQLSPDPSIARERFLLIVADIYVQKNLLNFFRAAENICRQRPDIRIKLVGAAIDPWYYKEALALIDRLGLRDKVEFLGRQPPEKVLDLYRRCLFLVFPSTAETFGNPLVEAMACGTPIACSNTSAMPEIVADAAVQFDPFDTASIAEVCLRLIDSADLRAGLAAKGLERSKRFSWDKAGRQCADALVQVSVAIRQR